MAISSYGITLKYGADSPTTVVEIKSAPSVLGQRSSLETTTLSDDAQTFIPGIRQVSQFEFTANWDKEVAAAINALDAPQKCELAFSDGTKFTWDGYLSVSNSDASVDAVLEMTITVTPTTVVVMA